jgi:hypothetical protein
MWAFYMALALFVVSLSTWLEFPNRTVVEAPDGYSFQKLTFMNSAGEPVGDPRIVRARFAIASSSIWDDPGEGTTGFARLLVEFTDQNGDTKRNTLARGSFTDKEKKLGALHWAKVPFH